MERNLAAYSEIAVLGFGLTGVACARFLLEQDVRPVVLDSRTEPPGLQRAPEIAQICECRFGELVTEDLLAMDLLIISPGLDPRQPPVVLAADAGVPIISEIELFSWYARQPVLAVTGSNGKSTVAELTSHLLRAGGYNVGLGGNIGRPALELLQAGYDVYVLELSSFQLEHTYSLAPRAAGVLNITADHLDRYANLEHYRRTKHRIYQGAHCCIWNRQDALTEPRSRCEQMIHIGLDESEQGYGVSTSGGGGEFQPLLTRAGEPWFPLTKLPLKGQHNWLNVQAGLAMAKAFPLTDHQLLAGLESFQGLPHRCELIGDYEGVRWVNDSKATNVGATVAAIEGFRPQVSGQLILIAGGDAKGSDLSELQGALAEVDGLITLGRDGPALARLYPDAVAVEHLAAAVAAARQQAQPGSLVLLSPACASLDMFADYRDRGAQFRAAVEAAYGN